MKFVTFAALLSVIVVLAACSSQTPAPTVLPQDNAQQPSTAPAPIPTPVPTPAPTPQQTPPAPSAGTPSTAPATPTPAPTPQAAAQDFAMDVHEFAFSPNTITVKQGVAVTITITNTGQRTHGFGLPDFNVNEVIEPGQTVTFTFTPDKTGTFRFFCSVPCGPGHLSMTGTLIVE